VGVGPGDPELVTVKAVRVLAEAGLVLVPVMAGAGPDEPGRAEATVRAHIDGARIRRVPFALSDRGGVTPARSAAWAAAAAQVAAAFAAGIAEVAFATIGDPNVYSTFSYLAQAVRAAVPEVTVRTVPGITAMQDLAARSGTVLAEGSESLLLLPLDAGRAARTGQAGVAAAGRTAAAGRSAAYPALRDALSSHDTVVAYKLGTGGSSPGSFGTGSSGTGGWGYAGSGRASSGGGEPAGTELGNTEPGNTGPGNTGPGNTGPGCAGPGCAGPGNTEPGNTGPGCAGPGNTEPGNTGPGCAGRGNIEPGGAEPGNADPGTAMGGADTAAQIAALLSTLADAGRLGDAVYGARLGLPGEDIRPACELSGEMTVPYLSTLIVPARRAGPGSKLR
jgi:precorrin-2/cobalt-factor-2 C20-methyltransferase